MMLGSLTLDQLRVLATIADNGSFSAAGRKLRRVQSAVSQSVRTLESTQGVELFDRSKKTPTLTEVGRVLVAQARQVLRQAELFESIASDTVAGLEPELTLAVDSFMPTRPVIDSLQALRETYPNLPVTFYTEGLGAAERRLRSQSAALALCALFPTAQQELQAYPLVSIALIPVVSSSHPLATETRPITREVLQEHIQLILTDPLCRHGISAGLFTGRLRVGNNSFPPRRTTPERWTACRTEDSGSRRDAGHRTDLCRP
jgi:DNA-binding transcriptional LysR family regulator